MDLVIVIIVVAAAVFFSLKSFVKIFKEEEGCGCGSGGSCPAQKNGNNGSGCCAEFPLDKPDKQV